MNETSYRMSHQGPEQGRRYDDLLYGEGRYDAEVWKLEQLLLQDILQRHFPRGIENCLDFACGTGRLTSFLHSRSGRTIGVDVSEEMLKVARAKVPKADFILGDLTRDPHLLADRAPFDCITVFRFFLNAEPELREAALRALAPLLAPGGVLICNNHGNVSSLWFLVLKIRKWLGKPPQKTLPYPEMLRLLRSCGFRVESTRGICFLPRGLTRLLPAGWWTGIERVLGHLGFLARFGIYQVHVAVKAG